MTTELHFIYDESNRQCNALIERQLAEAMRAKMLAHNLRVETELRRVCEAVWFPAGYRLSELTLMQTTPIQLPFFKVWIEVRYVPPPILWLRRQWRRFFPYRIDRFLGRKVSA